MAVLSAIGAGFLGWMSQPARAADARLVDLSSQAQTVSARLFHKRHLVSRARYQLRTTQPVPFKKQCVPSLKYGHPNAYDSRRSWRRLQSQASQVPEWFDRLSSSDAAIAKSAAEGALAEIEDRRARFSAALLVA